MLFPIVKSIQLTFYKGTDVHVEKHHKSPIVGVHVVSQ